MACSYVYLANMIGRYFDASVVLCSENVFEDELYNESTSIANFMQKVDLEYGPADIVLPYEFTTNAE